VTRIIIVDRVVDRTSMVLRAVVNGVHLDGGRGPSTDLTRVGLDCIAGDPKNSQPVGIAVPW